jgi:hypothetical protein
MRDKQTVELENDMLQDEEQVDTDLDEKQSQVFPLEDEEVLCTGVKPAPPRGGACRSSFNYSNTFDFCESNLTKSPKNHHDITVCQFCQSSLCHDKLYKNFFI